MADDNLLIILGNQLFPLEEIKKTGAKKIFMKEDLGLCTDFKHHKLKILFFLGAPKKNKILSLWCLKSVHRPKSSFMKIFFAPVFFISSKGNNWLPRIISKLSSAIKLLYGK